jgi:UDP-N-acetyl-D-galactosamine dehydrogenase
MLNLNEVKLAIIGLGYVGLPLPLSLANTAKWWGLTSTPNGWQSCASGTDHTLEVTLPNSASAGHLVFTTQLADLQPCNVHRHGAHPH